MANGHWKTRSACIIILASVLLHLPVSCDLVDRVLLLSPNTPGVQTLRNEVLNIACLPILIGLVLAVWSLRTTHGRIALTVALTLAATVSGWHAYHFSVLVPEIRTAKR